METRKKSNWVWSWTCGWGKKIGPKQIMANVVKKVKKQAILLGFFIYLKEYLLKQEAVVVKPLEWKFMAIIARSAKF